MDQEFSSLKPRHKTPSSGEFGSQAVYITDMCHVEGWKNNLVRGVGPRAWMASTPDFRSVMETERSDDEEEDVLYTGETVRVDVPLYNYNAFNNVKKLEQVGLKNSSRSHAYKSAENISKENRDSSWLRRERLRHNATGSADDKTTSLRSRSNFMRAADQKELSNVTLSRRSIFTSYHSDPSIFESEQAGEVIRPSALPRLVVLHRQNGKYGFVLLGAKTKYDNIRALKFVPSPQVPALQYLGSIAEGSAAAKAGLTEGDFILEVNGYNVVAETHDRTVSLIKQKPYELQMKVVSPSKFWSMSRSVNLPTTMYLPVCHQEYEGPTNNNVYYVQQPTYKSESKRQRANGFRYQTQVAGTKHQNQKDATAMLTSANRKEDEATQSHQPYRKPPRENDKVALLNNGSALPKSTRKSFLSSMEETDPVVFDVPPPMTLINERWKFNTTKSRIEENQPLPYKSTVGKLLSVEPITQRLDAMDLNKNEIGNEGCNEDFTKVSCNSKVIANVHLTQDQRNERVSYTSVSSCNHRQQDPAELEKPVIIESWIHDSAEYSHYSTQNYNETIPGHSKIKNTKLMAKTVPTAEEQQLFTASLGSKEHSLVPVKININHTNCDTIPRDAKLCTATAGKNHQLDPVETTTNDNRMMSDAEYKLTAGNSWKTCDISNGDATTQPPALPMRNKKRKAPPPPTKPTNSTNYTANDKPSETTLKMRQIQLPSQIINKNTLGTKPAGNRTTLAEKLDGINFIAMAKKARETYLAQQKRRKGCELNADGKPCTIKYLSAEVTTKNTKSATTMKSAKETMTVDNGLRTPLADKSIGAVVIDKTSTNTKQSMHSQINNDENIYDDVLSIKKYTTHMPSTVDSDPIYDDAMSVRRYSKFFQPLNANYEDTYSNSHSATNPTSISKHQFSQLWTTAVGSGNVLVNNSIVTNDFSSEKNSGSFSTTMSDSKSFVTKGEGNVLSDLSMLPPPPEDFLVDDIDTDNVIQDYILPPPDDFSSNSSVNLM